MFEIMRQIFRRPQRTWIGNLIILCTLATVPLCADTVLVSTFSTQNPSFDPNTGDAWTVGTSGNVELAAGFQDPSATSSYLLTQIQVADNFFMSDPNSSTDPALNDLIVGLWVSATNNPNTAVELQSWSVAPAGGTGNPGQIYTVDSATPTIINPNDYYFITENVTPDGADTAEWGWQENNLTPFQIGYWSGTYGTPDSFGYADQQCPNAVPCNAAADPNASGTPVFSVSGNVITTPEPRSYAILLTAGLLGLFFVRRPAKSH